jgi:hypothetical protein
MNPSALDRSSFLFLFRADRRNVVLKFRFKYSFGLVSGAEGDGVTILFRSGKHHHAQGALRKIRKPLRQPSLFYAISAMTRSLPGVYIANSYRKTRVGR